MHIDTILKSKEFVESWPQLTTVNVIEIEYNTASSLYVNFFDQRVNSIQLEKKNNFTKLLAINGLPQLPHPTHA